MENRFYCGIGSRKTPSSVCEAMTILARKLDKLGFTLRSGGADGADLAFEKGATKKQIFLPWEGFNGNPSPFHTPSAEAEAVSRKLFPHFPGISRGVRLLVSRNMHQVLGPEPFVSPKSEFIICWTENGKAKGGTAYAIKAAKEYDIPVFNLFNDVDRIKLFEFLEELDSPVDSSLC